MSNCDIKILVVDIYESCGKNTERIGKYDAPDDRKI